MADVLHRCPYYGTGRPKCDTARRKDAKSSLTCEGCGFEANQHVCPHCHSQLPDNYMKDNNKMVALVGPTASGKSTYLAVLINELMNSVGEEYRLTVEYGDETIARYQHDLYEPLFKRKVLIAQTPSIATDSRHRARPLVFRIAQTKERRGLALTSARPSRASLVFFDSSGQDATMGADMHRYMRYLKHAAGLIYMLDPTELEAAEVDVRPSVRVSSSRPRSSWAVIQDATQILRPSNNDRIKVPAAVVLTKADMLKTTVADSSPLDYTSSTGALQSDERDSVNEFVRALLRRWNMNLEEYMLQNYERSALFAVSSLGRPPQGPGVAPEGIQPRHVSDPLLWMLRELGVFRIPKR